MHQQFRKNLAKLLVCVITIPYIYNDSLPSYKVYGQEIEAGDFKQKSTDSILQITEMEMNYDVTTTTILGITKSEEWDGVSVQEPLLEDGVYIVTCADEFAWLENAINTGAIQTSNLFISVANDIDFNGHNVIIGTATYPFEGNFTGNGYTLYNLNFTDRIQNAEPNVGLFGYVAGASLSNINIESQVDTLEISATVNNFGCLVGYADHIKKISDIGVKLSIDSNRKPVTNIGAVIGAATIPEQLVLDNIDVTLEMGISSYKNNIGGIIGKVSTNATNCDISIVNSNISIYSLGSTSITVPYLGGAIGYISSQNLVEGSFLAQDLTIDVYSEGTPSNFGGITSQLQNFNTVDITNCNMNMVFKSQNSGNTSGSLVGTINMRDQENTSLNIENCEVTGVADCGGPVTMVAMVTARKADVTFSNCKSYLEAQNIYVTGMYYGSLVAYITQCKSLTVTDCENHGTLSSRSCQVSGLVGYASCFDFNMTNCKNYGNIEADRYSAGGLVSQIQLNQSDPTSRGYIKDCINYGNVLGYGDVGGILGIDYGSITIDSCKMLGSFGFLKPEASRSTSYAGGIVGASYPGSYIEITNCYVDLKIINPLGSVGGLIGANWGGGITLDGNTVKGNLENTFVMGETNPDYSFSGLISQGFLANLATITNNTISDIHLETKGTSSVYSGAVGQAQCVASLTNKDNVVFENNTLSNLRYCSTTTNLMAGLLATADIVGHIQISKNVLQDLNLKSNNPYSSSLLGKISNNYESSYIYTKNNFIQSGLESNVENGDLIGYAACNLDFAGNIVLVRGTQLKNGYGEVPEGKIITQSLPNYYNKDIRNNVENVLFSPLSTTDFKEMKNFMGLDFDNTWAFTSEHSDYPILGNETYSMDTDAKLDLCVGINKPIAINISHPSLLSSIQISVEDEDIVSIENGKIVPLKDGTTKLIFSTEGLPLSNQLEYVQTLTVKDFVPNLSLKPITIAQGDNMPTVEQFISSFKLEHPFETELDQSVTLDSNYQIVSIKDYKGNDVNSMELTNSGDYTFTIKAQYNGYITTQNVIFTIKKVIKGIEYDNSKIKVDYGTDLNYIQLPGNAHIIYNNGTITTLDNLVWTTADYNPTVAGEYIFSATITLPADLMWQNKRTVTLYKTIEVSPKKIDEPINNGDVNVPADSNNAYDDDDDFDFGNKIENAIPVMPSPEQPVEDVINEKQHVTVSFQIGRHNWYVDGETQSVNMDQVPELKDKRAYVPLRFLSYALQVASTNLKWDNSTKTVEIIDGDNTIKLQLDNPIASINGINYTMDGKPYLSNGRIMIPISQIQGLFEHRKPSVAWEQDEKQVDITLTLDTYNYSPKTNSEISS